MQGVASPNKLNREQLTQRDERFQTRMDKLENLKKGFTYLIENQDTAEAELDKGEYKTHLGYIGIFVKEIQNKAMSVKEVNKLRAEAMHKAAESKSNEKGVWKISTELMTDIRELLQKKGIEPSYNLLTKREFDEIIKNFKPK